MSFNSKDLPLIVSRTEIKGCLPIIEIHVPLLCLGHTDGEEFFFCIIYMHPHNAKGKNISALAL